MLYLIALWDIHLESCVNAICSDSPYSKCKKRITSLIDHEKPHSGVDSQQTFMRSEEQHCRCPWLQRALFHILLAGLSAQRRPWMLNHKGFICVYILWTLLTTLRTIHQHLKMYPHQNGTVGNDSELDILLLESKLSRTIFASFIAIAAVCGTVGDCLMLYIYTNYCRGDQRKKYLFGIALAALIISLIYYPLIILELVRPDVIIANRAICLLTKYVKLFVVLFYLFSIVIVSLWNYIFFAYPLKGRIWIKTSRVIMVWTTAVFLAMGIVTIGYFTMEDRDRTGYIGHFRCWDVSDMSNNMFIKAVGLGVAIPCVVLVAYFNGYVYRLACKVTSMKTTTRNTNGNLVLSQNHAVVVPLKNSGRKQSCLLGMTFFLIWVPFVCIILVKVFCPHCFKPIFFLVFGDLFFFLGSFAPLLMFLMTKKYKNSLLFVISCGRKGGQSFHGGSTRYEMTTSTIIP